MLPRVPNSDQLAPAIVLLVLSAALLTSSLYYSYSLHSLSSDDDHDQPNIILSPPISSPHSFKFFSHHHHQPDFFGASQQRTRTTPVNITTGLVSGSVVNVLGRPISTFKGIPFGGPTNGRWRFQHPRPARKWLGILFADKFGPSCVQIRGSNRFGPFASGEHEQPTEMSEDCLYLNVWTPVNLDQVRSSVGKQNNIQTGKPVMVYVPGRDFYSGTASDEKYDGSILSSLGDVVVVTFNYRLGALGWFTLYTQSLPGNQGLFDQILALKWVQENIRSFGGDPGRVTLFGSSAGAISISSLITMNTASSELFSRIILQSGSVAQSSVLYSGDGLNDAERFAQLTGCYRDQSEGEGSLRDDDNDDDDLKHSKLLDKAESIGQCLTKLRVSKIIKAESSMIYDEGRLMSFLPRTDTGDELISDNIINQLRLNKLSSPIKEIMIGTVEDEGGLFISNLPKNFSDISSKLTNDSSAKYIQDLLSWLPWPGAPFLANYVFNGSIAGDSSEQLKEIISTLTAVTSLCPTQFFGEIFSSLSPDNHVYYYHVSFNQDGDHQWPQLDRVYNANDLAYVFGLPLKSPHLFEGSDIDLARELIRSYSSFAWNGVPSLPKKMFSSESWPLFNPATRSGIEMNSANYRVKTDEPLQVKCNKLRITLEI